MTVGGLHDKNKQHLKKPGPSLGDSTTLIEKAIKEKSNSVSKTIRVSKRLAQSFLEGFWRASKMSLRVLPDSFSNTWGWGENSPKSD